MKHKYQSNQTGSVVITIIVMLVIASLSVGIAIMFTSSSRQAAQQNIQTRARNLAEAGIRYAAGQYRDAGDLSAKFDRLAALHEEEVTLLNNDGSFQLFVFPYWFLTANAVNNATRLSLIVPGKFPDHFEGELPTSGMVKIMDDFYDYSGGTTTHGTGFNPDQFAITIDRSVDLPANTSVQLAWAPPAAQTVTAGGDLTIFPDAQQSMKDIFPERNGLIEIFSDITESVGTYRYRERVAGSVVLSGITAVDDSPLPVTIHSGSRIVIKKQAVIESIGSLGSGSVASSKGVGLNVYLTDELVIPEDQPEELPLGGDGGQDEFNDEQDGHTQLDNWEFDRDDTVPESEKLTVTTHVVRTEFGDQWDSSNYVTFQNFTEVETDKGYSADLINKERLPEAVRNKNFNGVWGNASDNIYFVGDDGTIVHFDGTDFIDMTDSNLTTQDLNAIWGLPAEKTNPADTDYIFVVGDNGTALINEGLSSGKAGINEFGWLKAFYSHNYDIYAAWGTSWGHFDGYGEDGANPYNWDSPNTAHILADWNYYRVTYGGHINFRSLWATSHRYPYRGDLTNRIDNTQNIIVGEFQGGSYNGDGVIMHEFYLPPVVIPDTPLRGVWGSSFTNIYAVGDSGSIYYNTSNGDLPDYENNNRPRYNQSWQGNWKKVPAGDVPTTKNLNGVFGNSADDFYVIGDDGTILYNKGNGFELVPTAEVTTQTLNSIWGSDRTGIYAVGNNGTIVFLGYPENKIGGHILPLSKNVELASKWSSTQKFLSYTIQVKHVWGDTLKYGASGMVFRWHQPIAGKFAGYGISFVQYRPYDPDVNDLIPDAIKPGLRDTISKHDRLLVVLWEQYVQGGAEKRRWVAYKDISEDSKMIKAANGSVRDLSSLIVRVQEKKVEGVKVNDIVVYYGNASNTGQSSDDRYNNTRRNRYNPTFGAQSGSIKYPVFNLADWSECPNGPGGILCAQADSFTLVDNVSVDDIPVSATSAIKYWIVNPSADLTVLKNNFTIRTSRFTSPDADAFGSQSDRSEIGLQVFGDIGDYGSQTLVSFADFAVQLGVEADAVDMPSSFGNLQ